MNRESAEKLLTERILKDSSGRRDICTIYSNADLMEYVVNELAKAYEGKVDYIAAPESLGFILGSCLSTAMKVGFIPIRNGEVAVLAPEDAIRASYIDHRDHARRLQVRKSNLPKGSRILLVDDWVETGSTLHACRDIIEDAGALCVGIAAVGCNINDRTQALIDEDILTCIIKY